MTPDSILNIIRKATIFDIFIVSFFVLPIAASQWVNILEAVGWNVQFGLIAMVVLYVGSVALMMYGNYKARQLQTARALILGYLHRKGFTMVSFERIRQRIDPNYDDLFLTSLIKEFPTVFRKATLKGKRAGLARLDTDDTEEPAEGETAS